MKLINTLLAFGLKSISAHPHDPNDLDADDICAVLTERQQCSSFDVTRNDDGTKSDGMCTWLAGSNTCVAFIPDDAPDAEYCAQFDGRNSHCSNEDRCGYNPSTASCIAADSVTCSMFDNSARHCRSDASCAFVGDSCINAGDVTCDMMSGSRSQCNNASGCEFINGSCIAEDDMTCRLYDGIRGKCESSTLSCDFVGDVCCDASDVSGSCPELDDIDCRVITDDRVCSGYAEAGICQHLVSSLNFLGEKEKYWSCWNDDDVVNAGTKTEVDPCDADPCANGQCENDGGGEYECDCNAGWEGDHCDSRIDLCSPDPCSNGSGCDTNGITFECDCVDGYTGDFCEISPPVAPSWTDLSDPGIIQTNEKAQVYCAERGGSLPVVKTLEEFAAMSEFLQNNPNKYYHADGYRAGGTGGEFQWPDGSLVQSSSNPFQFSEYLVTVPTAECMAFMWSTDHFRVANSYCSNNLNTVCAM